METFDSAGAAVDFAVRDIRTELGDPTAAVAVLAPNHLNNWFARKGVAALGPQIRIFYHTPSTLVSELAARELAKVGLRPETSRRRAALVTAAVRALAAEGKLDPYTTTLQTAGWRTILSATVHRLEAEGLNSEELVGLGDGDAAKRIEILRNVLRWLERAREEHGLAGPERVAQAALHGIADPQAPCNALRGVVMLGDQDLDRATFRPLKAWVESRRLVRVEIPPIDNVRIGEIPSLRALRRPDLTVSVGSDATELSKAQAALFGASQTPLERDGSLLLLRTPDEVRENEEVVRLVQSEVQGGTPLDRIAIVLPDASGREPLATALAKASIPAVWFVTRPLSESAAAKFLLLALGMVDGKHGCESWHDLLRQRRLRTNANVGSLPISRGRWRRYLAECGAFVGAGNIARALRTKSSEYEDVLDREGSISLARTLEVLSADIARLAGGGTLAEQARRWRDFLRSWWRYSPDLAQVLGVLGSLESAGSGIEMSFDVAVEELQTALESTQLQEGELNSPAVRVLPPMACAGADFDVVLMTGVVQGRLPVRPTPEPLLNEQVIEAIRDRHPDVVLERDSALIETRRFAAAVSSARERLYVSIPAYEGLADRPRTPSVFALDLASAISGGHATYRQLDELREARGSLAQPWSTDAERAIGAREWVTSSLAAGSDEIIAQLTSHRFARGLLELHLGLANGAGVGPITIAPTRFRLEALDGAPLSARDLADLLKSPGSYLYRRVLAAYRPRRLRDSFTPLAGWWIDQTLAEAVSAILEDGSSPWAEALGKNWSERVSAATDLNGFHDEYAELVVRLGRRQTERMRILLGDEFGELKPLKGEARLVPQSQWTVQLEPVRIAETEVVRLLSAAKRMSSTQGAVEMMALRSHGEDVSTCRALDPRGKDKAIALSRYEGKIVAALGPLASLLERGAWPWGGEPTPWMLAHDARGSLDETELTRLTTLGGNDGY